MSFATQTFTGSVSGAQGAKTTSGTFSASLTGNADGSVTGTWTFTGTYADPSPSVNISGSTTLSGALTSGPGATGGPWTLSLVGSGGITETATLSYANGQYSFSVTGLDYTVDYLAPGGYDSEFYYKDQFEFNVFQTVAGAAPSAGTVTITGGAGPDVLTGSTSEDIIYGMGSDDSLSGASGNDTLAGGIGEDTLDGGTGNDIAVFDDVRNSYTVSGAGGAGGDFQVLHLPGQYGNDTVTAVERLQFTDLSVNLGVGALAHTITTAQLNSVIELYIAYLARVPDADGMTFWINQLKSGQSLDQIGNSFYNAAVQFSSLTGYSSTMTNAEFVRKVYLNVLGRSDPDQGGVDFWSNALATGTSRGTLVASMLTSAHSFKGRADFGWVADLLDNKIAVGKTFAINEGLVYNTSADSITHGMEIAAAVTPTGTAVAITLIGVTDGFNLY